MLSYRFVRLQRILNESLCLLRGDNGQNYWLCKHTIQVQIFHQFVHAIETEANLKETSTLQEFIMRLRMVGSILRESTLLYRPLLSKINLQHVDLNLRFLWGIIYEQNLNFGVFK